MMGSQGIWKIDDSPPGEPHPADRVRPASLSRQKKNPAVAASLSLLIWGGGQIYNGDTRQGLLYLLFMAGYYAFLILNGLYGIIALDKLRSWDIPDIVSLSAGFFSYLAGLLIWHLSILQAYGGANRTHGGSFNGIDSRWLGPICSLLFPGWGQLVNGQPRKGAFFLLSALFTYACVLLVSVFAPYPLDGLEPPFDKEIIETILLSSLLPLPLMALLWLINVYDALAVAWDPIKKEPLLKRLEYARNRLRMRGLRGYRSRIMNFFLLLLLLAGLAFAAKYLISTETYISILAQTSGRFERQGYVKTPYLIDQAVGRLFPKEHENYQRLKSEKTAD